MTHENLGPYEKVIKLYIYQVMIKLIMSPTRQSNDCKCSVESTNLFPWRFANTQTTVSHHFLLIIIIININNHSILHTGSNIGSMTLRKPTLYSNDQKAEVFPIKYSSSEHHRRNHRFGLRFQCGVCLCTIFIILNVVYTNLLVSKPPLELPLQLEPWQLPSIKVYAVLFFKEESHALVEVLLHLFSQGVDHVILVDNMSQHPLPLKEFQLFGGEEFVTLRHDRHSMAQKRAYRSASQLARWKGADWLLAVDADEFPWATQLGSISNYLALRDPEVCTIAIPFRFFGSDGREEQPNSLIHGFVGRANHTLQKAQRLAYKTVARVSCTLWMAIHHAAVWPRFRQQSYAATDGFPRNEAPILDDRTERVIPDLVTNHYRTQSHRFFLDIKQTRGRPNNNGKVRDERAFRGGDSNDTMDFALVHKTQARFPSLYQPVLALQPNHNYTSPWPLSNVQAAIEELKRHQVLVIMDADQTYPDTLATATRNAAILDPTVDCVVRVPPGHVQSIINSNLLKFCKAFVAFPETQSWKDFVQTTIGRYASHYQGFIVMESQTRLRMGMETAPMRRAAMVPGSKWKEWTEGVETGRVWVVGK